jgi:putative PIN family toxin of toxin-antitoxin system
MKLNPPLMRRSIRSGPSADEDSPWHQYSGQANPRAGGSARALLLTIAHSPDHPLILSPYLLEEVERVLAYPRLRELWPLSPDEIREYTQALDDIGEMVYLSPVLPAILADPKDDPVVETAVWGRVDALCTLDRDFYTTSVVEYVQRHSIQLMNDVQLLVRLRQGASQT